MRLDRLTRVENYILQQGSVSFDKLAEEFGLSINTARRDITELEKRGRVARVRGGAISKTTLKSPSEIDSYRQMNQDAKQLIGSLAASLIHDGQTLFFDAGSTAKACIPYLKDKNVTIITNSVNVLTEAAKLPSITLIVLGGEYSSRSDSFHSYSSIEDLNGFNIDISFLGTTGISVEGGLTTATYMEGVFKRNALKRAQKSVVLADHSKFGRQSTSKFADLSEIDIIVTDAPLPNDLVPYCASCGIQIISPSVVPTTEGNLPCGHTPLL